MIEISENRERLYQWETNIKLLVDKVVDAVQFKAKFSNESFTVKVTHDESASFVVIPNILLQESYDITAYALCANETGFYVHERADIEVEARIKPDDYIYTETELYTVSEIVTDALNKAKESGDFKGDKGDKGDPGDDYVLTDADKDDIAGTVINMLPRWTGGDY